MCCTFSLHAHGQTLLVAAVLTAVPLALVDDTVLVVSAGVGEVFAHCSLEEALAALTAVHPIVFTLRCGRKGDKFIHNLFIGGLFFYVHNPIGAFWGFCLFINASWNPLAFAIVGPQLQCLQTTRKDQENVSGQPNKLWLTIEYSPAVQKQIWLYRLRREKKMWVLWVLWSLKTPHCHWLRERGNPIVLWHQTVTQLLHENTM